jgi:hypothetical protein
MCADHHRQTHQWCVHLRNGTSFVSTELRTQFISHIKMHTVPSHRFYTWKMRQL